jgi:hypothetical protein
MKTTLGYHLTLLGWLLSKRQEIRDREKGTLHIVGKSIHWYSHYRKHSESSSRNKN